MPNWCENDLWISGIEADVMNCAGKITNKSQQIRLQLILPVPTELLDIQGMPPNCWKELNIRGKLRRIKVDVDALLKKYGSISWYDWSIKNWGTKWDINECDVNNIKIYINGKAALKFTFSTAWSPPKPIIEMLGLNYKKLKFDMRYYECGLGYQGRFTIDGGHIVRDEENDQYRGDRGG